MSDTRGRCSYCHLSVGRKKVKECSECRAVRYCSKRCQTKAWPEHKKCCNGDVHRAVLGDPTGAALLAALTRWSQTWRDALHEWSLWAMDLPNHPEDRLATHVFLVELETRPNPPSERQYFRMLSGSVVTRENVLENLVLMGMSSEKIEAWKNDLRGNHTIQTVIYVEGMIRFLWSGQRDASTGEPVPLLDNTKSTANPEFSGLLAQYWEPAMIAAVEKGDPSLTQDYVKTVIMNTVPGLRAIISEPRTSHPK